MFLLITPSNLLGFFTFNSCCQGVLSYFFCNYSHLKKNDRDFPYRTKIGQNLYNLMKNKVKIAKSRIKVIKFSFIKVSENGVANKHIHRCVNSNFEIAVCG